MSRCNAIAALLDRWRSVVAKEIDVQLKTSPGLSMTNKLLCAVIILAIILGILETEASITSGREKIFQIAEYTFGAVFTIEYFLRVWASSENPQFRSRIHYIASPMALLDLAIMLTSWLTIIGASGFLMRIARFAKVLRIVKLGRYSSALRNIYLAIRSRKEELLVSLFAAIFIMTISSVALYAVESEIQPEQFGSIPRAMWWSVATLTTVGYGDVYPVTLIGRILATITAISGVGLIAMPAGILASAFSDLIQKRKA